MAHRDGGSPDLDAAENLRYVERQKLYLERCEPTRVATLVVNNEDLTAPTVMRILP